MILTSIKVAPNAFVSSTALLYVLSVVPKQGIVTHIMPFLSKPASSKALFATIRACVESRPPLIPITTFLVPICSILFFKPKAWILRISSQRLSLTCKSLGTNGCGSKNLLTSPLFSSNSKLT